MKALKAVKVNWFPVMHIFANVITNSIYTWLAKDSPDMIKHSAELMVKLYTFYCRQDALL